MTINLAFGVETMLLNRILAVVRSAVLVLQLPAYLMRLPPTVHQTRLVLVLLGLSAATMWR
jgi:hypothetical protein